jgi:hypothetical protein
MVIASAMDINCQSLYSGGRTMFSEEFEKLNSAEKDSFREVIQFFLVHTYIVETDYDFIDNMKRTNKMYLFAQRHLELLQEYFDIAGFTIESNPTYGVFALHNLLDTNRFHFDPMTTKIIFVLRLIYDEKRSQVTLSSNVFVTVSEIVQKLITLSAISKKIPQNVLRDSFRQIANFQIIQKQSGNWYDPDTRFLILPSILFIVTNDQVTNIQKLADSDSQSSDEEEDDNHEETDTSSFDPLV